MTIQEEKNTKLEDKNTKLEDNIKKTTEKSLENQPREMEKARENISEMREVSKSLDSTNYSNTRDNSIQDTINLIQSFYDNYFELQKTFINPYELAFSLFKNNFSGYYSNNFIIPTKYLSLCSKINQSIIDNSLNTTRALHEFLVGHIETSNKSRELFRKYFKENIKIYLMLITR